MGRDTVAAVGLVVFWSSGFIGADLGTRDASSLTLLAWRYLFAGVLAVAVLAVLSARRRRVTHRRARHAVVVGLLTQAGYLSGIVGGVALGVDAGTAALVAALQPLVVAFLAHAAWGERTTSGQRVGLALGLMGVLLVVLGDLGQGTAPWWAYLLPLGGMLSMSVGTVLERRAPGGGDLLGDLAVHTLAAGAALVGIAAVTGRMAPPESAPGFWVAVVWLVLLATVGGYGCYLVVLRRSGPQAASTLLYLTPPVTAAWAGLQLGQVPGLLAVPGALVCAAAVWLVARRDRPRQPVPGAARA
ncbi:DMT family transporter [Isoptericola sp. S6320L]|uniref:DMT family transporter n=1 Tax=Isoptericola sp. S6320L TaxID=2926411 RepID=UPI001FF68D2B|nr:DMT family transporter [Isoptericola sp. S6320L]MCK0117764.1 DMT family transporter [Isoptericola sp. S6320L]